MRVEISFRDLLKDRGLHRKASSIYITPDCKRKGWTSKEVPAKNLFKAANL